MKQKILSVLSAAAILVAGMTSHAHAAVDRLSPHPGALGERVKEKLGLSDEQAAKIKTELRAEKDAMQDLAHRWHIARTELREVVQHPNASEGSIRHAAAKLAKVEADAAVLRARLHRNISPILTDEQKAQVKESQKNAGLMLEQWLLPVDWL